MSTKAEIQALTDSDLATASSISATEHRNVLKDDVDSFLENGYADALQESTSGTTVITTSNASFKYFINIQKSFRRVTLNGQVIVQVNVGSNVTVFSITDAEYQTALTYYTTATNQFGDVVKTELVGNNIVFTEPVQAGETFDLRLTYFTTN